MNYVSISACWPCGSTIRMGLRSLSIPHWAYFSCQRHPGMCSLYRIPHLKVSSRVPGSLLSSLYAGITIVRDLVASLKMDGTGTCVAMKAFGKIPVVSFAWRDWSFSTGVIFFECTSRTLSGCLGLSNTLSETLAASSSWSRNHDWMCWMTTNIAMSCVGYHTQANSSYRPEVHVRNA